MDKRVTEWSREEKELQPDAALLALYRSAEDRRILFEQADPAKFDAALSASPRDSASEAAQMVQDRHGDLSAPAETAASVDDLQNRKLDAPVALSSS